MRIFILITMLVVSVYAKALFSNSNQADVSEYMGALKDLIVATQKTRGVTIGYRNGNTSALLLMYEYRSDMKKAIGTMESLPLASDPIINSRATSISQSLTKLNAISLTLSSDELFTRYTENIAQSLMLAQTVNKKSFNDLSDFGKLSATVMLESILPLTENIGELRALGTGAAALGHIDTTDNMFKIKAIIKEIKKINEKFQSDQMYIIMNHKDHFATDVNVKMKRIQNSIDGFITLTEKEILKKDITTNPSQYFSLATDVISEVIVIFDINNKAIIKDSKGWL